ncbi:hypothetical protein S3E15_02400 [Bacillus mycoides]|nr:hypothetical protein S3E15_02400 [Bacillus mycoides]
MYMGTGLDEEGILLAIEQLQPKYLFISFDDERELEEAVEFIDLLQEKNENISGGFIGRKGIGDQLNLQNILIGNTKEEWDGWLKMPE